VEGNLQSGGVICEPLDDKESETRFEVMSSGSIYSLLSVVPISGRMHQIRRHLEMVGHPVAGDKRYGAAPVPGLPGFALHSFRTILTLPDERTIGLCSPLPEELLHLCEQGGIDRNDLLDALYKMI
jgi:23S rRNA pseudouridine955/2504/2580 synthase